MKHVLLYTLLMGCFAFLLIYAVRLNGAPSEEAYCPLGACPTELSARDSGSTLQYRTGEQMVITLDERRSPTDALQCEPVGVVGFSTNAIRGEDSLYSVGLDALEPGNCMLQSGSFTARIIVRDPNE